VRPIRLEWREVWVSLGMAGTILALAGFRVLVPERSLDGVGPRALLDGLFALALAGVVCLVAMGLGRVVLARLRLQASMLEMAFFALPLGLGGVAYAFAALAFVHALSPLSLTLMMAGLAAIAGYEVPGVIALAGNALRAVPTALKSLRPLHMAVAALLLILLIFAVVQALAPPWDYDGLMYHLYAPKLFLRAGGILSLPDTWQANGPLATEMLFAFGLALGSDVVAKLVHLTFGLLLAAGTYAMARRLIGEGAGWIALAALVGVPLLPSLASLAYADLAWATFQFGSLYALVLWRQNKQAEWLAAAGAMAGFALGSKYLALGAVAVLIPFVLWESRKLGVRCMLRNGLVFSAFAAVIGSPWYVKNWILLGNPVFPFYFPTETWTRARIDLLMAYLSSFGAGHRWDEFLLLPWDLYFRNEAFGTFMRVADYPGMLFPLAAAYRLHAKGRQLDMIAIVTMVWFLIWALGSQQTRFLLPVFPLLSVLACAPLAALAGSLAWPRFGRVAAGVLAALSLTPTLVFSGLFAYFTPTSPVVLGLESKSDFLKTRVTGYRAMQYIQSTLPREARVLMMWDGQGYYCDERCLPDAEQSQWVRWSQGSPDPATLARQLKAAGITHLLYSKDSIVIIEDHDPTGVHRRAEEYFREVFAPACASPSYGDEWVSVFEITCTGT